MPAPVKGDSPTSPGGRPPPRDPPGGEGCPTMTPAAAVDRTASADRRPDQHGSGDAAVPAPETDAREDRRRHEERWQRRRRLERQLHDGAALRISSLALRLGVLDRDTGAVDPDRGARHRDILALQDEVAAALEELR